MDDRPRFLFACCQRGAEHALKAEVAGQWPALRFAFSRPGFVTFKLGDDSPWPAELEDGGGDLKSVFARCHGISLGRVETSEDDPAAFATLAAASWKRLGDRAVRHWHVWERDAAFPGDHGFEPQTTAMATEAGKAIDDARPTDRAPVPVNLPARPGELVADCVLVEPRQWWIGFHRARAAATRWPGGAPAIRRPEEMISRAYLKMCEALAWSRFPLARGDVWLEIGSSPGGACQALLDRGLTVIGVDPAAMDERLTSRDRFRHIRKRAEDMKRAEFRGVKWLATDSNVAPETTLAIVEDIVTHRRVNIRGLLLTIKLLDWEMAASIPDHLARVRSWGYAYVRARQLAHNRQEYCIAALRSRSMRRPSLARRAGKSASPPAD